jgi:predicted  nucleic acid-binding Zn-ribbon protein
MEEKIFNLIESMYSEMNKRFEQMNKKFEQIDEKFEHVDKRFDEVNTKIAGLENKLGEKIDALFDGYIQNTEAINRLETKLDALAERVDKQEVEIRVIKGAK